MRRGRSSVSDFLNNFNAAYDTATRVAREVETAQVARAMPEESTGFTADQGQQLEGLAKQGYKVDFDEAKNAYVARNDAGDTKTIAMQGVTDFMGDRYAGQGRDVADNARAQAYAGVMSKYDPEAGMRMAMQARQGIFGAKRQAREEKQWAREDSIDAIDQESGAALKAAMVGADGKPMPATPDMYLTNIQQRAGRLAQAGHSKQAEEALHQFYGLADAKIRLDAKNREKDAAPAMAAFQAGNTQALVDYYNKYVPGATKITGIARGPDGGYVINSTGLDGKPAPARTVDQRGMLAMAQSLNDPSALLQHAWAEANFGLRLRGEARADNADRRADRADSRAAQAHGLAMADRSERLADRRDIMSTREALAREQDPNISEAGARGARLGITQISGTGKERYNYDPTVLQKAFGELVPSAIPGERDTIKRDAAKEKEFLEWFGRSNIRDMERGLVEFNRMKAQQAPKKINGDDEWKKLPPGTRYIDPNGVARIKPAAKPPKEASPLKRQEAAPRQAPLVRNEPVADSKPAAKPVAAHGVNEATR